MNAKGWTILSAVLVLRNNDSKMLHARFEYGGSMLSKPKVQLKTSKISVFFEVSIFNNSSKIQWQEKSFHHTEGNFVL